MSDFLNFSIQTRTEFKNWICRQLGYPTVTPELTDEQLNDTINDALEEFKSPFWTIIDVMLVLILTIYLLLCFGIHILVNMIKTCKNCPNYK